MPHLARNAYYPAPTTVPGSLVLTNLGGLAEEYLLSSDGSLDRPLDVPLVRPKSAPDFFYIRERADKPVRSVSLSFDNSAVGDLSVRFALDRATLVAGLGVSELTLPDGLLYASRRIWYQVTHAKKTINAALKEDDLKFTLRHADGYDLIGLRDGADESLGQFSPVGDFEGAYGGLAPGWTGGGAVFSPSTNVVRSGLSSQKAVISTGGLLTMSLSAPVTTVAGGSYEFRFSLYSKTPLTSISLTAAGATTTPYATLGPISFAGVADNTTLASLGWTVVAGSGVVLGNKTKFGDYAWGFPAQTPSLNTTLELDLRLDGDVMLHAAYNGVRYQYIQCQGASSAGAGVIYVYSLPYVGSSTFIAQINLKDGAGVAFNLTSATPVKTRFAIASGNQLRVSCFVGGAWVVQGTAPVTLPAGYDTAGYAGVGNEVWATNSPGLSNIVISATDMVSVASGGSTRSLTPTVGGWTSVGLVFKASGVSIIPSFTVQAPVGAVVYLDSARLRLVSTAAYDVEVTGFGVPVGGVDGNGNAVRPLFVDVLEPEDIARRLLAKTRGVLGKEDPTNPMWAIASGIGYAEWPIYLWSAFKHYRLNPYLCPHRELKHLAAVLGEPTFTGLTAHERRDYVANLADLIYTKGSTHAILTLCRLMGFSAARVGKISPDDPRFRWHFVVFLGVHTTAARKATLNALIAHWKPVYMSHEILDTGNPWTLDVSDLGDTTTLMPSTAATGRNA